MRHYRAKKVVAVTSVKIFPAWMNVGLFTRRSRWGTDGLILGRAPVHVEALAETV